MKRTLGSSCLAVVTVVGLAGMVGVGAANASGINLSWDDCGAAGAEIKTFACDTNTGAPFRLVASFMPPASVDALVGFSAEVRVEGFTLPDWWAHGTGQCRGPSALVPDLDFRTDPGSCLDPWNGEAAGGLSYQIRYYGPGTALMRVSGFVPESRAVATSPTSEYNAFRVLISRDRTVEPACAGCALAVRLRLDEMILFQRASVGFDPLLTEAITRNFVHWQGEPGPPPEVHAFTPTSGRVGDVVTIRGRYFTGVTRVDFDVTPATFTEVSDSVITAIVPPSVTAPRIRVTTPRGSTLSAGTFQLTPTIRYFIPRQAPVSHYIAITGNGFTRSTGVHIDGVPAHVQFRTDTLIQAVVPTGAVEGPIVVTESGASDTSETSFRVGPWLEGFLDLAWNDCAEAGSDLESFACNTNEGSSVLIGSFIPPPDIIQLVGFEAELRVAGGGLPDWWRFGSSGCRGTSGIAPEFDFRSGPQTCKDLWAGQAGGWYTYDSEFYGPGTARLRVFSFGPERPASPDSHYYAFRLRIQRTRTVGPSSCSGCGIPVGLTLQQIHLFQDVNVWFNPPALTLAVHRSTVNWQGTPGPLPIITSFEPSYGAPGAVVTVRGSRFTGAHSVRFDLAAAAFTVVSDSVIVATVPDSGRAGPIHVTTIHGSMASAQNFIMPPRIVGFSPAQGQIGSSVSIFGENFLGTDRVEFAGVPASSFRVASATSVVATVPDGAIDGPIMVANPAGSSVSASSFHILGVGTANTINLAWDDCGGSGSNLKTFTCDSNSGPPLTLVGSYVPPSLPEFLGAVVQIDIRTRTALPDWWRHGTTYCRGTIGLATNFDFTNGPFSCEDFNQGQAAGGFAYDVGFGSPNRARLRIQFAVPFDFRNVVAPPTEYYGFKVNLLRSRTTGEGSCSGCTEPACIVLNEMQLFQPPNLQNDPVLTTPGINNFVHWQSAITNCPGIVPILVSLMSADATPDRVRLVWQTEDIERATIHRREGDGPWLHLGTALPDGQRRVHFEDLDVVPGATYDYRLGIPVPAGEMYVGEARVTVPLAEVIDLGLSRVAWHPTSRSLVLSLTLPRAGSASLELFDVNGRRVEATRLDGLKAGHNDLSVRPAHPLTPGVFFARLMLDGVGVSRRFVVVQ